MVSAVAQHIAYLTASQLHDYSLRFFSFFGKPRVIIRVPAALGFADAGLAALFSAFRGELAVQFRVHFLQEIQIAFFAKILFNQNFAGDGMLQFYFFEADCFFSGRKAGVAIDWFLFHKLRGR